MTIERINQKHALLVAQRDQLNANLNATIGAIAACEELRREVLEDQSKAAAAAIAAAVTVQEPPAPANDAPEMPLPVELKVGDKVTFDDGREAVLIGLAPEMPAVSHFVSCDACPDHNECEAQDNCAVATAGPVAEFE